ncbi:hypothetical protein HPB47_018786 [Ixodes persulcatus]|uniref:Uncharacterized protein n=1 Tax=Ixodes persulcatus TaxID=34615 RepID=A0AC60QJT5_IXOPE|nr:hypothetical protein HPB47_018786 [Ixodes persulcatus]
MSCRLFQSHLFLVLPAQTPRIQIPRVNAQLRGLSLRVLLQLEVPFPSVLPKTRSGRACSGRARAVPCLYRAGSGRAGPRNSGPRSALARTTWIPNVTPVRHRPYRMSASERKLVQKVVDRMVSKDIVQPSPSPFYLKDVIIF